MMTDGEVRCAQCRTNISVSDELHCNDCRWVWQSRGWRRFAEAMMRGVEPDEEARRTLH
jgi:hypothetical protein